MLVRGADGERLDDRVSNDVLLVEEAGVTEVEVVPDLLLRIGLRDTTSYASSDVHHVLFVVERELVIMLFSLLAGCIFPQLCTAARGHISLQEVLRWGFQFTLVDFCIEFVGEFIVNISDVVNLFWRGTAAHIFALLLRLWLLRGLHHPARMRVLRNSSRTRLQVLLHFLFRG